MVGGKKKLEVTAVSERM